MAWFLSPSPFPRQPGSAPWVPSGPFPQESTAFLLVTSTEGEEQVYRKHMAVEASQNSLGRPPPNPFPRAGTGSWTDRRCTPAGSVHAHALFGKCLDKARKSLSTPSSCVQTHRLTGLPLALWEDVGWI